MELVFKFHSVAPDRQFVEGRLSHDDDNSCFVVTLCTGHGRFVSRPIQFNVSSIDDCFNYLLASGYSTITIKYK